MKKTVLAVLIIFLLALTFPSIPNVSATTEDLWTTPGLPEEIPREPISDSPSGDYLNTTNPYADITGFFEAWYEFGEAEGDQPLYVLVFADEEEREISRSDPLTGDPVSWGGWALGQLERGDEALVAVFGIDIRVLGFLEWDSDDNLYTMDQLWYELESDTEQYLGEWYDGSQWSSYVDAIIGITAQDTPLDEHPISGLSSGPEELDQWRIFTLLKWQVYWADDNLVQHEVSHLFYAPDHLFYQDEPCCVMAQHTHYVGYTWEDMLWWIFNNVPCGLTSTNWCFDCFVDICLNVYRYSGPFWLNISTSSGGTTSPIPGNYTYDDGTSETVSADANLNHAFDHWVLDGIEYSSENPITVTMNHDHTLEAYFYPSGGLPPGGGGDPIDFPYSPTLFVWNGSDYVKEVTLDVHGDSDVTVWHTIEQLLMSEDDHYLLSLRELNESLSHIDYVKLYAVDTEGEMYEHHLTYAVHNELENVKQLLLFDDDSRVDLGPSQTIDLEFNAPEIENIAYFIFEIQGYEPS